MRTMILSVAVLAALGLAACSGGAGDEPATGPAQSQSSATVATASTVSGSVTLVKPRALSDQAVMTIRLVDLSAEGSQPLAEKVVKQVAFPVDFQFPVKPSQINSKDLYAVQVNLVDGERHFEMALPAPVLTRGATNKADIMLRALPTEGEKVLAAFNKVKAQLGAMSVSKGSALHKDHSRSWQVFRDMTDDQVQFVIGLTDHFGKGNTHTEFAYKDGKPWVVIRTERKSEHGKPSEIDRVSWDKNGAVVLNEKEADGHVGKLDADMVASLKSAAEKSLELAKKSH